MKKSPHRRWFFLPHAVVSASVLLLFMPCLLKAADRKEPPVNKYGASLVDAAGRPIQYDKDSLETMARRTGTTQATASAARTTKVIGPAGFAPAGTPPDESVAWQNNALHDGYNPASRLVPPLTLKWSRDFSGSGVTSISYPLIAQGLVFITTATANFDNALLALDEHTGATIWSADVGGSNFANAAYDSGKVFVVNGDGLMKAFDAAVGTLLWSVSLPGQYSFTSPPTAVNGIVFTGGAGSGGTVYAVDETNGAVLWMMPVENGDHSSPAVTQGKVFVSYACPQSYSFDATSGQQLWHYSSCCGGGGGKTPVVHAEQVYVRDDYCDQTGGLVLDANTGTVVRGFDSDRLPAFFGDLALFLQSGTLRAVDSNGQVLWSFAGDGDLTSAPLIANQTIYIGSNSGTLYGLNATGQQIWSTQVGAPIPAPDEHNFFLTTGLGAGDGLLIVPAGSVFPAASVLAAYGPCDGRCPPTPRPRPAPAPRPTPPR
jgi:outer membrane protein assembly factor BamB